MVASNPNQLLERAEGTANDASQRIGRDKSEDAALGVMVDAVRAMWQAMNAVLLASGISTDDDQRIKRINEDIVGKGILSKKTIQLLFDAESAKSRVAYDLDDADAGKAMRLLEWANEFIGDTRQAVKKVVLGEHDVVRILHDLESDGYDLKSGMTGTIVNVYNAGEAYAVEISGIEDGPAVVTLRANDMQRTWKSDNG
jgi:hypothetical protein